VGPQGLYMTFNSGVRALQRIAVIGAGGFAREVLDVVNAINKVQQQFEMLGYIVDGNYGKPGDIINDYPILGDLGWMENHPDVQLICGVGAPEHRRRLITRAASYKVGFCTLIHPAAVLTSWVEIGYGTVITAGCVLTNQIRIGNHVHLNLNTTVGHDSVIEDFVTVSPGVNCSGNVHLSEGCFIGTGATIIEKLSIGRWSVIGAGSVIIQDVPANSTVVGVPGKVIKTKDNGWHLE
jgi:sugar O-acyltransferase (sialic acid O-acetyltransferase NeuD family)